MILKVKKSLCDGNNISPSISANGKIIYFCSDFKTGRPQIYSYNLERKEFKRITGGGYCASPSYSNKRNALAYAKMINGAMQLFLYDIKTKLHMQLTSNYGNKEECSWSPCGNYLIFSVERSNTSRIAMLNLLTQKLSYLTPIVDRCSYPAWSSYYAEFPVVLRA